MNSDNTSIVTTFSQHTDSVNKVLRINSQQIVTVGEDSMIKVWNTASGTLICSLNNMSPVKSAVVLPNGLLATGSRDALIRIWNLTSSSIFTVLQGHTGCVNDLVFNKMNLNTNGNGALVSCSDDTTCLTWDLTSNSFSFIPPILGVDTAIHCAVITSGINILGASYFIRPWPSTTTGYISRPDTSMYSSYRILSMAVFPDSETVACGLANGWVSVFDSAALTVSYSFQAHSDNVTAVQLMQKPGLDQVFFATSSVDGYVKIWAAGLTSWTQISQLNMGYPVNTLYYMFDESMGKCKSDFVLLKLKV
jgi:WD40 repeat protein